MVFIPVGRRPSGEQREEFSYFGPALMTGQDSVVQCSVMVPYSMLIWLKKSTARERERGATASPRARAGERELTVDGYPLVEVLSLGQLYR